MPFDPTDFGGFYSSPRVNRIWFRHASSCSYAVIATTGTSVTTDPAGMIGQFDDH